MIMSASEITELMESSSLDAVKVTAEEFNITLDFSVQSVALVDDILLSFLDRYNEQALEEQAVFTLCNLYGAYVGEVFRRNVGGDWVHEQKDNADFVFVSLHQHTYTFSGICYERLVNDSNTSIMKYFAIAMENAKQ